MTEIHKVFIEVCRRETGSEPKLDPEFGTFAEDLRFFREATDDRETLERQGVGLAEYVASRRVDEGLTELSWAGTDAS